MSYRNKTVIMTCGDVKMKVLGITGGIGAGKSTVTEALARLGAAVVDADRVARRVMEPGEQAYTEVVRSFGKGILNPDETINRKALADIVFTDEDKLKTLNGITHPCIFRQMQKEMTEAKAELVVLDVPLLFSADFPIVCDKTLAVLAPEELRIRRVMNRDGCTGEKVLERMAAQMGEEELRKRADFVIMNDEGMEKVLRQTQEIYEKMTEKGEEGIE